MAFPYLNREFVAGNIVPSGTMWVFAPNSRCWYIVIENHLKMVVFSFAFVNLKRVGILSGAQVKKPKTRYLDQTNRKKN